MSDQQPSDNSKVAIDQIGDDQFGDFADEDDEFGTASDTETEAQASSSNGASGFDEEDTANELVDDREVACDQPSSELSPPQRSNTLANLDSSDPLIGQTLFDQYLVVSCIGSGSMSSTYEGIQQSKKQIVAIKTTKFLQLQITKEFAEACFAHGKLKHPNIVKSLAFLESPLKRPFFVTEFLDGVSLEAIIDATGALDDENEIAEVVLQICDALNYAHESEIAHGDLSVSKVMLLDLDDKMIVKMFGFCFSRVQQAGEQDASAIPWAEQKQNDILKLAEMVIAMVTGDPNANAKALDSVVDNCHGLMAASDLVGVLHEAVEPDLDWRFESINEFKEAFLTWLEKAREARQSTPELPDLLEDEHAAGEVLATRETAEQQVQEETNAATGKPVRRKKPRKSIKKAREKIANVKHLRQTQLREEDSLAVQLTGVFKGSQGPRQSPVKSIAQYTFKLVASIMIGLLSLTYIVLNWEQLTDLWYTTSDRMGVILRRSPGPLEEEPPSVADKRARLKRARTGSTTGQQTSLAARNGGNQPSVSTLPPEQKRFRYEENPAYRHWVLRDVGAKRRLDAIPVPK